MQFFSVAVALLLGCLHMHIRTVCLRIRSLIALYFVSSVFLLEHCIYASVVHSFSIPFSSNVLSFLRLAGLPVNALV